MGHKGDERQRARVPACSDAHRSNRKEMQCFRKRGERQVCECHKVTVVKGETPVSHTKGYSILLLHEPGSSMTTEMRG